MTTETLKSSEAILEVKLKDRLIAWYARLKQGGGFHFPETYAVSYFDPQFAKKGLVYEEIGFEGDNAFFCQGKNAGCLAFLGRGKVVRERGQATEEALEKFLQLLPEP